MDVALFVLGSAAASIHVVKLANQNDLKHWLRGRPHKFAVTVAARAALRVTPLLASILRFRKRRMAAQVAGLILLPAFRGLAASWLAAAYTAREGDIDFEAAAEAVDDARVDAPAFSHFDTAAASATSHTVDAIWAATCAGAVTGAALRAASSVEAASEAAASHAFIGDMTAGDYAAALAEEIYKTTSIDASELASKRGGTLATKALWLENTPSWAAEEWKLLRNSLLSENPDWRVWVDWYEARLAGHQINHRLELARVRIANEIWADGPRSVNRQIAQLIEEYRPRPPKHDKKERKVDLPTVPTVRPAAVEPHWDNNHLTLPQSSVTTDLAEPDFAAALTALKIDFSEFAIDITAEVNIDTRFINFVERLAERIPSKPPPQDELFRLAHVAKMFEGYAKTVDEEWSGFLAARYHALLMQFARTLRQSALWREFERNTARETLSAAQILEAAALTRAAAESLRADEASEFVNPIIPESLDALTDVPKTLSEVEMPPDAIAAAMESLAIDMLESVSNVVKPIAEVAVESAGEYARGVRRGFKKAAKTQGPKDGAAAFKWLRRLAIVTAGGGTGAGSLVTLANLITKYPSIFDWLERVLQFLRHVG